MNQKENKFKSFNLGSIIKSCLFLGFIFIVLYGAFTDPSDYDSRDSVFPDLASPKEINYSWNYNGQEYNISTVLYGSVYEYYEKKPISYSYYDDDLPEDWEVDYYNMFLELPKKDSIISDILRDLKVEALKNNLNEDETVELVLSFVQAIPYDHDLAKKVLDGTEEVGPRYPYMVLYDDSGICSGKSFLAYKLLQELGYGVALFDYEDDKHLTIAIRCDKEYSSYNSGYCYTEITAPESPVGIFAKFSDNSLGAAMSASDYFNDNTFDNISDLGDVEIYLKMDGKVYGNAEYNIKTNNTILELFREISGMEEVSKSLEIEINNNEARLETIETDLNYYDAIDSVYRYNLLVPQYNNLLDQIETQIKNYNNYILSYNSKFDEMSSLIVDLYGEE